MFPDHPENPDADWQLEPSTVCLPVPPPEPDLPSPGVADALAAVGWLLLLYAGIVLLFVACPAARGQTTFTNTTSVVIPDEGNASQYPWPITVAGYQGSITSIAVTLTGFSHSYTDDLAALMVGPGGQKVKLFDGPGAKGSPGTSVSNLTLNFTDSAAAPLPSDRDFGSGSYKPGQDFYSDLLPLTQRPYQFDFGSFLGTGPNGTWSLYLYDFAPGNGGSVASWSVTMAGITPVPEAAWGMTCCVLPVVAYRGYRRLKFGY